MKILTMFTLAAAFLLSTSTSIYAQGFPYHLYEPRTLAELVEMNPEMVKDSKATNIMISAAPFYSAVRLEYRGESRPVTNDRLTLYKFWIESIGIGNDRNIDPMSIIEKEFLFKECGKEYWITVQTPAANDFPEDLEKGDKITLYLMLVGATEDKAKKDWDTVFFTNSFRLY